MARRGDIEAVRRVLYDRKRVRKMLDQARRIDALMNTDPRASLAPDDPRVVAGGGPAWIVPTTGELDPAVAEAAMRCRRLADLLRDARRELKDVDFDHDDKRELRRALDAHASAWVARGDAWAAVGVETVDLDAAVDRINRHDIDAARSYHKVLDYLDRKVLNSLQ